MNKVYVLEMLKWGDDEKHSYIVGVFNNREDAEKAGEVEAELRGGKYEYRVTLFYLTRNAANCTNCTGYKS